MKSKVSDEQNGSLSAKQLKTLRKFRQRLSAKVPEYRIVWVRPYNERIINVGLESQKKSATEKCCKPRRWRMNWKMKRGFSFLQVEINFAVCKLKIF